VIEEPEQPRIAVAMRGITKSFGGVRALNNVDFSVRYGEIHALLGENGAGKSTLLKVLRGIHKTDAGSIEIDGQSISTPASRLYGFAKVAMIFQEMSLVPSLRVAENVFLGNERCTRLGLIDDRGAIRATRALFEQFDIDIDPASRVADISAGQRQLTEIVKAISHQRKILILDEPTSALSVPEVERLFMLLRRLKAEGVAMVYVSHRMDEIMKIANWVTILRDGRLVMTAPTAELTIETTIEQIIGRPERAPSPAPATAPTATGPGEVLLELRGVSGVRHPEDVSLVVRSGEVVGVAGLLGSGRSSLARLIYGIQSLRSGEIIVRNRRLERPTPMQATAAGVALIPEDRIGQGLVIQHSVAANILLTVLKRVGRWSWISESAASAVVNRQIAVAHIKTASPASPLSSLSGGNQQKVVLGKWLATEPDILILDEPTSGIDIGSKTEIVLLIRELARQGKAILLISSEIPELIAASDRFIVMANGRIQHEFDRAAIGATTWDSIGGSRNAQQAEERLQVIIQKGVRNG
jgi:ribose transport system ATP-binding protein